MWRSRRASGPITGVDAFQVEAWGRVMTKMLEPHLLTGVGRLGTMLGCMHHALGRLAPFEGLFLEQCSLSALEEHTLPYWLDVKGRLMPFDRSRKPVMGAGFSVEVIQEERVRVSNHRHCGK